MTIQKSIIKKNNGELSFLFFTIKKNFFTLSRGKTILKRERKNLINQMLRKLFHGSL